MTVKKKTTILVAICTVIIIACNSSKKTSKSNVSSTPVSNTTITTTTTPSAPVTTVTGRPTFFMPKTVSATYVPGNQELLALKPEYKDLTLDQLTQGYTLYTKSACIGCHEAFDIYEIEQSRLKDIIDDMARKANISVEQKDAVYKYVLAIKATQPK